MRHCLLPERSPRCVSGWARTERRHGDDLSYRGFFDYNADRFGFQAERLVVEPNFLPEIGFLRRTDMRRNFALRDSARARPVQHVRKFSRRRTSITSQITRTGSTPGSRGAFQTEFINSDVATSALSTTSTGRSAPSSPIRVLIFLLHRTTSTPFRCRTPLDSNAKCRERVLRGREVLQRRPPVSRVNTARMQVTPQLSLEPSVSLNFVDLRRDPSPRPSCATASPTR